MLRTTSISPGYVRTELANSIDDAAVRDHIRGGRDEFAIPIAAVARARSSRSLASGTRFSSQLQETRSGFAAHPAIKCFSAAAVAQMEPFQPYHNAGSQLVNPLTSRVHVCFGTNVTGQPDVIFPDKIQGLSEWIAEVVGCFEVVELGLGACYVAAVIATVAVLLVRRDI